MLNSFISALITIFFSGVASKETEEKTKRASWMRVFIYGVLTTIVGVFFYKTYQVATIVNTIDVQPFRTAFYEDGTSKDTIEIVHFYSRLSGDKTYNNKTLKYDRKESMMYPIYEDYGGAVCSISTEVSKSSEISWYKLIDPDLQRGMDLPASTLHSFGVAFTTTHIPRLIPVVPSINEKWSDLRPTNSKYCLGRSRTVSLRETSDLYFGNREEILDNNVDGKPTFYETVGDGISLSQTLCEIGVDSQMIHNNRMYFNCQFGGSEINKMNFLTAADVSQFTYVVGVNSSLPVKNIRFISDIPIELTATTDWIKATPFGFNMEFDRDNDRNVGMFFLHVKLPTLANLQLIRSLILTTLITALVSLFAVNLYYCIRRAAIRYRKKHALSIGQLRLISRSRITLFKITLNILLSLIAIAICIWAWMIWNDKPMAVNIKKLQHYYEFIVPAIVLLMLLLFVVILYRYSHTPVKEEAEDEEPPTIFVHERLEEDDLDKVFDGLPEEAMTDQDEYVDGESIDNTGAEKTK